jgi:hypothetical protein
MKVNKPILGFIIGLILPILGDILVYFILFRTQMSFGQYANMYTKVFSSLHDTLLPKAMSLGVLINIAPFMFYTNKRLDNTARGIFSATILYATLILLLRFVW